MSFDALIRYLMRGDVLIGAYNGLIGPTRSIISGFAVGVGGIGTGAGAVYRAVRQWVFGPAPGGTGDDLPTESKSVELVASSSGGLNEIPELCPDMVVSRAASCGSLNSSYYSANDGDRKVYLLASAGPSQDQVGAGGDTAV